MEKSDRHKALVKLHFWRKAQRYEARTHDSKRLSSPVLLNKNIFSELQPGDILEIKNYGNPIDDVFVFEVRAHLLVEFTTDEVQVSISDALAKQWHSFYLGGSVFLSIVP